MCCLYLTQGYNRNSSSLSPRCYPSASTPQQSSYGSGGGMGGYGAVPMSGLGVPGSPGFNSASPNSSPYASEYQCYTFRSMMTYVWHDLPFFQSCHLAPLYQGRVHPPPSCLSHPSHLQPNKKVPSLLSWDRRVHLPPSVPPQEETASEVTALTRTSLYTRCVLCVIFTRVFYILQQWPASWFPQCRGQTFIQNHTVTDAVSFLKPRLEGIRRFRSSQSRLISLIRTQESSTYILKRHLRDEFASGMALLQGPSTNKYQKEVEFLHKT